MAERKGLSKKIRFEVFKRDKFTCQYCGGKAPNIVLQIDHIDPVANGGDNRILNLITSCFDCNSGKRDRKLDDNSVIEKQRRQLELLQERREQIELMIEWQKSLANLDEDISNMLIEYIETKISPYTLNENGRQGIIAMSKKHPAEKIIKAIDEGSKIYIKYKGDEIDQESIELFLSKIAGVLVVNDMPPIKKKLAYIKGIARNRYNYWDDRAGSIILENYVNALKGKGWDEDDIVEDLEKEVCKITKQARNWSQWKSQLEDWTDDILEWD